MSKPKAQTWTRGTPKRSGFYWARWVKCPTCHRLPPGSKGKQPRLVECDGENVRRYGMSVGAPPLKAGGMEFYGPIDIASPSSVPVTERRPAARKRGRK